MNKYYIDIDMKTGSIYIVPVIQDESFLYMIYFKARYLADQYLKKLISGNRKSPKNDIENYKFKESIQDSRQRVLNVYEIN